MDLGQVRPKTRIPISQAKEAAERVRLMVERYSEAVVLVGSIRRNRPFIGDVEFVVLPKDPETFDEIMTNAGFRSGSKKRKYTGFDNVYPQLKIEVYVARDPDELGAMTLTYTGDYLFNIAMRSQAKRMGHKLDQYGIWKGRKLVFQSPDEKDFFDFLGMDYHTPEERSLARRGELRKAVRELLARRLDPETREAVERAAEILKTREPLPHDLEARIQALSTKSSMGYDMGFQIPEETQYAREIVQQLYDRDVDRGGQVILVHLNLAYNIVQIVAEVLEEDESVIYLLAEMTDLSEDLLIKAEVAPDEFIDDVAEMAEKGEIEFSWQGPFRPMVE